MNQRNGVVMALVGASLLAFACASGIVGADEAKPQGKSAKPGPGKPDDETWWFDPKRAQPGAVAELVGLAQANPLIVVPFRFQARTLVVWGEPENDAVEAPPLNPVWLASIGKRDGKPVPNYRHWDPDKITKVEIDYYNLYAQALLQAFWTPAAAFAASARENRDVTFAHMYNEPGKYRGKVIHVAGRLKRVRKQDAPVLVQNRGLKEFYEGWIFGQTLKSHPYWVLFPILPDGLQPSESLDRYVEFDGYLIQRIKYKDGEGRERETLLLIGPTLTLGQAPPPLPQERPGIPTWMLYSFVGFVAAVALLMVVFSWIFRRGDRRVRDRLAQLQAQRTMEMLEQPPEPKPGDGNGVQRENDVK
jgi:hypothetical protein